MTDSSFSLSGSGPSSPGPSLSGSGPSSPGPSLSDSATAPDSSGIFTDFLSSLSGLSEADRRSRILEFASDYMPDDLLRLLGGSLDPGASRNIRQIKQFGQIISGELALRSLRSAIPYLTPGYTVPSHLDPILDVFEDPVGRRLRCVIHAPPRHAKTDTVMAALARLIRKYSGVQVAYLSYSAGLADNKSRKCREMALRFGVKPSRDRWSAGDWLTADGSGFFASGVGGELIGRGFDIIVVDDPVKNRVEAESASYRSKLWDWFWDVVMTRLEPGCSVFVMMHRWHKRDIAGRLIDEEDWNEIWLPAVAEEGDPYGRIPGTALWPSYYPLPALTPLMKRRYTWRSVYQGRPVGRGTGVFEGVNFYRSGDLPVRLAGSGTRSPLYAVGIDLAAGAKKGSDTSVAVVMMTAGDGRFYVLDAKKRQVHTPKFVPVMKSLRRVYGAAKFVWHFSGMEKAVGQFLKDKGLKVDMQPAKGNKLIRAEPFSDEWNAGNVFVPEDEAANPWRSWFIEDILDFDGMDGGSDDAVDASSSAYWKLRRMLRRLKRRRHGKAKVY